MSIFLKSKEVIPYFSTRILIFFFLEAKNSKKKSL